MTDDEMLFALVRAAVGKGELDWRSVLAVVKGWIADAAPRPAPETRDAMARAIRDAWFEASPVATRPESAADLAASWLAAERAKALEEAAAVCDHGIAVWSELSSGMIKVISQPQLVIDALADAADAIRALAQPTPEPAT